MGGVQGHVRRTGLEDAEEGRQQLHPPLQAERHPVLRAHAAGAEEVGDPVGARVQLPVRHLLAAEGDGHGLRHAVRLRLEEGVDAGVGVRVLRAVPGADHRVPLAVAQQPQLRDPAAGVRGEALQQHAVVRQQPRRRPAVEEVGGVLQRPRDPRLVLGGDEGEVVLGRGAGRVDGLRRGGRGRRQGRTGPAPVLQLEEHLEHGLVAQAAGRAHPLHHLLERGGLVLVRAQRGAAQAGQQLAHGGVAGKVAPQGQHVEEGAHEPLHLFAGAVGGRGAHDDVVLPGVAPQQRLPGGQEHDEQGAPLRLRQRAQPVRQVGGKVQRLRGAAPAGHGGAGAVRGQLQQLRRAGQLPLPELQVRGELRLVHPAVLPGSPVAVLQGRLREGRRVARGQGGVARRDLADEQRLGGAVRDHVVHHQHDEAGVRTQAQQQPAQQGARRQVEVHAGLLPRDARRRARPLAGGQGRQVLHPQGDGRGGMDHLHGAAVASVEGGAQDLVPRGHVVHGARQQRRVHGVPQLLRHRLVVRRAPRVQLVDDPEPALLERERHGRTRVAPRDGGGRHPLDGAVAQRRHQPGALLRGQVQQPVGRQRTAHHALHAPLAASSAPSAAWSSSTRSMSSKVVSGLASTARRATTGIPAP